MSSFIPFNRDQAFLLPPDLKSWLPADDVAHFIVAAVGRVPLGAFAVPVRTGGKPQYHPRLMLALLIHCYANGLFSSRGIERATYRDVAVRFVAANLHPDHDTIASFRRSNTAAIEAAFLQVLLLAHETGLLRLGTVSIDDPPPDIVIPPRATSKAATNDDVTHVGVLTVRDGHVRDITQKGRMAWQKKTGYGRRSLVETAIGRYKQTIGPKLRARSCDGQQGEAAIAIQILNRMIRIAKPVSVRAP